MVAKRRNKPGKTIHYPGFFERAVVLLILHTQVVHNSEHVCDLIGANAGERLVGFSGNDAFKRKLAISYDDVDGGNCLQTVATELTVRVDLKERDAANVVIKGRSRQNFKLVDDASDAFNFSDDSFGAHLQ